MGGVAIAAAVAAVVIAPWSVYVSLRFHEPILLTDTSGYNFWDGHHPVNGRVQASKDLAERDRLSSEKHEELRAIVERCRDQGLGRRERSRAFFSAAKAHLEKGDPTLVEASWDNFASILRSWPDPVVHGWPLTLLFAACLGPMGALGALGLAICLRRRRGVLEVGALGLLFGLTALAIAFVGLVRYRFVHIDPVLAVFAPVGWQATSAAVRRIFFRRGVHEGGDLPAVPA